MYEIIRMLPSWSFLNKEMPEYIFYVLCVFLLLGGFNEKKTNKICTIKSYFVMQFPLWKYSDILLYPIYQRPSRSS